MLVASIPNARRVFDPRHAPTHQTGMEPDWSKIVTEILQRLGLVQTELAKRYNVSQPTVSRWLTGSKPDPEPRALILAEAERLGIFDEDGPRPKVPIVGRIGLGAVIEIFAEEQPRVGEAKMPPRPDSSLVSLKVHGDVMLPMAEDGWVVYYRDEKIEPNLALKGKPCIVCLESGQMLLRKIYPGRTDHTWDLIVATAQPLMDQAVQWVAPVLWIQPQ